ncbi:MAG: hypothetical protein RG741_04880 [Bacteroidales bacterium]|nr:hypothetical protein [Bacteroidales bacterium]
MKTRRCLFALVLLTAMAFSACDDDSDGRSRFIGRYEVTEYSLETFSPRDDYEVRIRKDIATEDYVVISNFYNLNIDVLAQVDGNDLLVAEQTHGLLVFEGSGRLSGNIIVMDYTVTSSQEGSEYFDRLRAEMTFLE